MAASIDIVIVNWNAGPQLGECLRSIPAAAEGLPAAPRVILVDNASTDDSFAGVELAGTNAHLIRNSQNRGFAQACNQGAKASAGDYLLFLNPDTRLSPGCLAASVAVLEDPLHRRTGVLGVQLMDAGGRVAASCSRFPTPGRLVSKALGLDRVLPGVFPGTLMSEWDHSTSRVVDQVMGAYFLVRRPLFEELDGFDERFFVYFEEVDFCRRARAAGWNAYFSAEVRVFHKGQGTTESIPARRLFYSLTSRLHYSRKHFGRSGTAAVAAATLFVEPAVRLFHAACIPSCTQAKAVLSAYSMLWRSILAPPSVPPERIPV